MSRSLEYRYKSRHKMEICLSQHELSRGFAYRSRARCDRYYRVGDVRKAKDRQNCSLSARVEILKIAYSKKARKTKITSKITFRRIKENRIIHYIHINEESDFHEKFNECKANGTALHYVGCLWLCKKPMCEYIFNYGNLKFCDIPIKEETLSKRKQEAKQNGIDK